MATMKEISIRGGKIVANQASKTVSSGVVKTPNVQANATKANVQSSARGLELNVRISGYSDYKLPEQFKSFPEVLRPVEVLRLESHFRRIFSDLNTVNDLYVMGIGKNFVDSNTVTEVFITEFNARRLLQDTQQTVNRFSVSTHKPYNELFTKTETVRLANNKVLQDLRGNSEVFFTVTQFVRTLVDILNPVERFAVDFNKSSLLTDFSKVEHVQLEPSKYLSTQFSKADTHLIAVVKGIADTPVTMEELVLRLIFNRYPLDVFSKNEHISIGFSKPFVDTFTKSELFLIDTGKRPIDILSNTELFVRVMDKVLRDTPNALSTVAITFAKPFAEQYTQFDVISLGPNKFAHDNAITTEILTRSIQKTLHDIVDATDDFNGILNLDDEQTADMRKILSDHFSRIDKINLHPDKHAVDAVNIASERLVFHFTLRPIDTLQAIEAFDYVSGIAQQVMNPDELNSVLEEQLKAFVKVFKESAVHTEDYRNTIHKPYFDTQEIRELVEWVSVIAKHDEATSEDSGFVNNQGYFLGNYVAHGYIGQNTYF